MKKNWTWSASSGSAFLSSEKIVKTPIWVWERVFNPYEAIRIIAVKYPEKFQEIIDHLRKGRITDAGSLIDKDIQVIDLSFCREDLTYRGDVYIKYYNGTMSEVSEVKIFDNKTKSICHKDAVYGNLYMVGRFWLGDMSDKDPDTYFLRDGNLTSPLGERIEIDGQLRWSYPYYNFKHLDEIQKNAHKIKGADVQLSTVQGHNLNTYFATKLPGKSKKWIHYVGGCGSDEIKSNRYFQNKEWWTPDVVYGQILPLNGTWGLFMAGTWANPNWYLGLQTPFSEAEEQLGLYDGFVRRPGVYFVEEINRYTDFVKVDGKPLNFSGCFILGGPVK